MKNSKMNWYEAAGLNRMETDHETSTAQWKDPDLDHPLPT